MPRSPPQQSARRSPATRSATPTDLSFSSPVRPPVCSRVGLLACLPNRGEARDTSAVPFDDDYRFRTISEVIGSTLRGWGLVQYLHFSAQIMEDEVLQAYAGRARTAWNNVALRVLDLPQFDLIDTFTGGDARAQYDALMHVYRRYPERYNTVFDRDGIDLLLQYLDVFNTDERQLTVPRTVADL